MGEGWERVGRRWKRVGRGLGEGWERVGRGLGEGWERVEEGWERVCRGLGEGWEMVGRGLGEGWQRVGRGLGEGGGGLAEGWERGGRGFGEGLERVWRGLGEGWQRVEEGWERAGRGLGEVGGTTQFLLFGAQMGCVMRWRYVVIALLSDLVPFGSAGRPLALRGWTSLLYRQSRHRSCRTPYRLGRAPKQRLVPSVAGTLPSGRGGGGSDAQTKSCVSKIGLQFRAGLIIFAFS